ncbi:MAG TPA: protein kinase [Pyrinomonadaceae bacterium]|nr:protein kinase [Pyrinomonadaceae bacterium]
MIGQVFGNYKVEQKLGEGGMGEVYRGVDMMLEREVAIKFLRPELASQQQVVERFRSEAKTLAKLNHPNIATLYSFMRAGDSFIMVLEFVRGVTLDTVIQQRGAIAVEQAVPIFCQVLDGIQHAHEDGIIHRDIKPANMMLTEKGTLKVLDFGIARILGTARMTRQGNIIGTIEYMRPEQVRGFETDARSDIYSLGMLLYEMLTGRCPFDIQNEFELMKAQIEQYPVPPRQLNPAIPEVVEQAIWKAIQKDPNQRFQSAAEFRAFLLNAGYAATGRIEPLPVGDPGAFATRPVSQPSFPPSPYLTTPMQPGFNTQAQAGATPSQPGMSAPSQPGTPAPSNPGTATPSQPGVPTPSNPGATAPTQVSNPGLGAVDPMAQTLIGPPPGADAASKETRIGTAPAPSPQPAGGAKETRIGPPPGMQQPGAQQGFQPQPQGFPPQQPGFVPTPQAQQQSSGSKKWIYIAGAGVAAVVLLVVVVAGGALFMFSGSKKNNEPVKPAALAEEPKPTTQPTEQPAPTAEPAQASQPADSGTSGSSGGDAQVPGAVTSGGTTIVPVEQPTTSGGSSGSSGSQGTTRTATKQPPAQRQQPAQQQPRQADSAAEAARKRREAALRALDQ